MFSTPYPTTIQQLPRLPLTAGAVRTLHHAKDFAQTLLTAIANAEHRIYLCTLYLENDEAGQQVMAALHLAKSRRPGLDICVFVDWHRAQRGRIGEAHHAGNAAWYQQLRQQHQTDIPVYGVAIQTRELFGVLHLKGFTIDDTVIYSGASLNNVYLHKHGRYRHDRYHVIHHTGLANSMVNYLQTCFLDSTTVHRLDSPQAQPTSVLRKNIKRLRKQLRQAHYPLPQQPAHDLSVSLLVGLGHNNPMNRHIIELLSLAQQQIVICTPYFNLPKVIGHILDALLARGVSIEIIVGDKKANDFFIPVNQPFKPIGALPYLYETNLRRFAKRHQHALHRQQLQLRLWQDQDNSFHLKGIWVDNRYQLLTGNNLNPRAFSLDLENGILIDDRHQALAMQTARELDSIRQHTRRIHQYTELESPAQYPEQIGKLLRRISRIKMDRLLNRLL